MQHFQKKYKEKGLIVFSIGNINNKERVKDYVMNEGLSGEEPIFPVFANGWNVYRQYGGRGTPNTYVVDRKGMVRFVHRNFTPGGERIIQREIEALFAESY